MGLLRRQARSFAYRHVGGTAVVLIYHRVADLQRDPQRLAVSPERFEAQMRVLAERFRPVRLADLAAGLEARRVTDGAVAVTFDDGYADNLLAAAPVLETQGVPATVFVSSGYLDGGREFWWDEVERLVLAPGTLPERLELTAGDVRFSASLHDTATYTPEQAAADAGWDVTMPDGGERQRLYRDVCAFVRPLPAADRDPILAQLRAAAGDEARVRETHRPLTAEEARALDTSSVVEVGGHTVTHPVLSRLSAEEQRAEVADDRRRLTGILGHAPAAFSYPYGGLDAYDEETVRLVGEAGYEAACSNHLGVVKPWTGPYRIPRVCPGNIDAEAFAAVVQRWFDEPR